MGNEEDVYVGDVVDVVDDDVGMVTRAMETRCCL